MKPLSVIEMQNLAQELKTFEGSRLQEVRLLKDLLCLGLYSDGLFWLIFDLNGISPQVILLGDLNELKLRDEKKPIVLFLKANVLGAHLIRIEANPALGRVLILHFSNGSSCELRLFPRGPNVIVQSQGKSIALHKPTEIKPLLTQRDELLNFSPTLVEKSTQWLTEWKIRHQKLVLTTGVKLSKEKALSAQQEESAKPTKNTQLKKIEKAIQSIERDLKEKRAENWQEAGEWLKAHQSLNVPFELAAFIDAKKSFSYNLARCFEKSKELQKKIAGAEARIAELQKQILRQDSGSRPGNQFQPHSENQAEDLHEQTEEKTLLRGAAARGRTFQLSGGAIFYVGKSAEDNLRILRKAKPWYYWLHLRDEPSAHGILTRNKNQKISQSILHEAAHCLLTKTYGERQKDYYGQKFAMLVAECRFVRPIKGDRIGRVHYSSETSFLHLFKNS